MHGRIAAMALLFSISGLAGCIPSIELPEGYLAENRIPAELTSEFVGNWQIIVPAEPLFGKPAHRGPTWRITSNADGSYSLTSVGVIHYEDESITVQVIGGRVRFFTAEGVGFAYFEGNCQELEGELFGLDRTTRSISAIAKLERHGDGFKMTIGANDKVWRNALMRHKIDCDWNGNRLVIRGSDAEFASMLVAEAESLFPPSNARELVPVGAADDLLKKLSATTEQVPNVQPPNSYERPNMSCE